MRGYNNIMWGFDFVGLIINVRNKQVGQTQQKKLPFKQHDGKH